MPPTRAPAPRDVLREGLARVWESGGRTFVTFELVAGGRPDPDLWVQWIDGEMNLRWPRDDDPRTALPRLGVVPPAGATIGAYAPDGAVVLHALDVRIDDAADFLDLWFRRALGARAKYEVETRIDAG